MSDAYSSDPRMLDLALLIARIVFGLLMSAHGAQKLFGWFGGYGLHTTGEFFVQLGFRPGRAFATIASAGEIASGLLVALGFLGPVGPAIMLSVMLVAAISVHWKNGLWAASNGIELNLLYATGALGLALAGFGAYSLDTLLGIRAAWTPGITWTVLSVGVLGGILNLVTRRRSPGVAA
jgi:putative oxidoreductase